jgi:prevent-host-death family protein
VEIVVSKSKLKPKILEYLRAVETTHQEIIVTDRGRPVLKIVPYAEEEGLLAKLRDSVVRFDEPTEPVGLEDWEALR